MNAVSWLAVAAIGGVSRTRRSGWPCFKKRGDGDLVQLTKSAISEDEMPETKDFVEWTMSAAALLISVTAAIYAGRISRRIASSDYAAAQRVKADTARLIAVMRSVASKSFYAIAMKRTLEIDHERKALDEFLNSSTGFAYWAWAARKTHEGNDGQQQQWGTLFFRLFNLSISDSAHWCMCTAVEVEELFGSLSKDDLQHIVDSNADLLRGISDAKGGRTGDRMFGAIYKSVTEDAERIKKEQNAKMRQRLLDLREKAGVNDPDLDIYIGVMENDLDALLAAYKAMLERGVSLESVLRRYHRKEGGG